MGNSKKNRKKTKINRQKESRDRLRDKIEKCLKEAHVRVVSKTTESEEYDKLLQNLSVVLAEYMVVDDKIKEFERRGW